MTQEHPQISSFKKIRELTQRFQSAFYFLKAQQLKVPNRSQRVSLVKLPWFLMIGHPQVGKTSLLHGAELDFILEKLRRHGNPLPTHVHDWWVTKQAIFLDTPGKLIQKDKKYAEHFFSLIKKYNSGKLGIILVWNAERLIHKTHAIIHETIALLTAFQKTFSLSCPVFIVINKMDALTGFSDFFNELSCDERRQVWGFPLSSTSAMTTEFGRLLKRLQQQLFWKLEHEREPDRRVLVGAFPSYFGQLQTPLRKLVKTCFSGGSSQKLGGIFFTAANSPSSSQAYFTHDLLDNYLLNLLPERKAKFNGYYYLFFFMLVLCFIGGLFYFAKHDLHSLFSRENSLGQGANISAPSPVLSPEEKRERVQEMPLQESFSLKEGEASEKEAALAEVLRLATSLPASPPKAKFAFLRRFFSNKNDAADTTQLQKILLPFLNDQLVTQLTDDDQSPEFTYSCLKAYFMLGNLILQDPHYLADVFQRIWRNEYDQKTQDKLLIVLKALFQQPAFSFSLDQHIIQSARERLLQFSKEQLAYLILIHQCDNNQLLALNIGNAVILKMYTKNNFNVNLQKFIDLSAEEALKGNEILGKFTFNKNDTNLVAKESALAQKIREKYLKNYTQAWIEFAQKAVLIIPDQRDALIELLNLLTTDPDVIRELMALIRDNLPAEISSQSVILNNLQQIDQYLPAISKDLTALVQYLKSITDAEKPEQKAFELSVIRFQNDGKIDPIGAMMRQADRYPEPFKKWIYTLASKSGQSVLAQAEAYINNIWIKNIIPPYQAQLENRFPFVLNQNNEVSLESFTHFFASQGLFDRFITRYLKPFLETSVLPWQLKSLDGQSLSLSNDALLLLQKIYQIQQGCFNSTDGRLLIKFSLELISMESHINQVIFNLGSQKNLFTNASQATPQFFYWPDDKEPTLTSVVFNSADGKSITLSEEGYWAWLRLLSREDSEQQIIFDKDGYAAKFKLAFAKQEVGEARLINLFKNFKLPEELFGQS